MKPPSPCVSKRLSSEASGIIRRTRLHAPHGACGLFSLCAAACPCAGQSLFKRSKKPGASPAPNGVGREAPGLR